jgi:hypothetical protein
MAGRALRSFSEGGLRATESAAFVLEMPRAGARGASLRPAAALYARLVTIKGFMEPDQFLDAARRQLETMGSTASL